MTETRDALAETGPAHLAAALDALMRGEAPANLALMHLLMRAVDSEEAGRVVSEAARACAARGQADEAGRLRAALALIEKSPGAWTLVREVMSGLDHDRPASGIDEALAGFARGFDAAVRRSPEASVALYSLGRPELLAAATFEIVARLREWGLLGRGRAVLDIGCGIGRFEAALSGEVGGITGVDISPAMIEEARRRCAGLANVRLLAASGRDLSGFADAAFDLVLAVDSFPYLVHAGMALAERHVSEASRVLRPGGSLVVLNFSYRGDAAADRRDVARLAAENGFDLERAGTRDFALWDGLAFHLRRRAGAGSGG